MQIAGNTIIYPYIQAINLIKGTTFKCITPQSTLHFENTKIWTKTIVGILKQDKGTTEKRKQHRPETDERTSH